MTDWKRELNELGGTPLSKGRLPYTNQVPPTVAPKGAAGSTNSKGSPMSERAQVGDMVRLTIVIEGVAMRGDRNGTLLVEGYLVERPGRTVEILSRAIPPLPNEPGTWWLDFENDIWRVDADGVLACISHQGPDTTAQYFAPFRQLVLK